MDASLKVGVIGMGKVGPALASALRSSGHDIVAVNTHSQQSAETADTLLPEVPQLSIGEVIAQSDMVIVAVPDSHIDTIIKENEENWKAGQLVLHVSGAVSLNALEPAAKKGALTMVLHPAMTFTGFSLDVAKLRDCPIAITASPLILPLAQAIVADLGGKPYVLQDGDKAQYHAALSHAANHLVTLISQSKDLLTEIGIEEPGEYLRPLTIAALDGALSESMGALTGPVSRGDQQTIDQHLAVLEGKKPVQQTYRQLSEATKEELAKYKEKESKNDTDSE